MKCRARLVFGFCYLTRPWRTGPEVPLSARAVVILVSEFLFSADERRAIEPSNQMLLENGNSLRMYERELGQRPDSLPDLGATLS
jgi:hypothetical protein